MNIFKINSRDPYLDIRNYFQLPEVLFEDTVNKNPDLKFPRDACLAQ